MIPNYIKRLFGIVTLADALEVVRAAVSKDPAYAWVWHCNLAMMAVDAGANNKRANEQAAVFMKNLFGVDMRKHDNYIFLMSAYNE